MSRTDKLNLEMHIRMLFLLLACINTAPDHCLAAEISAEGKDYGAPQFENEIKAFEKQDREQPPPQNAILFVGSSTIAGWNDIHEDFAPFTIIPRGFGGSNMNDILHYADRIVFPYAPRAVIIYEGDNDIAQDIAPEKIRDAFRLLVNKLHKQYPAARVYVLSIKPSPHRWNMWPRMRDANKLLAEECLKDKRLIFVDTASAMLDADGNVKKDLFVDDGLHLNRKGYELWRDILRPVLAEAELPFEKQEHTE